MSYIVLVQKRDALGGIDDVFDRCRLRAELADPPDRQLAGGRQLGGPPLFKNFVFSTAQLSHCVLACSWIDGKSGLSKRMLWTRKLINADLVQLSCLLPR